jgi:hypothetical protein
MCSVPLHLHVPLHVHEHVHVPLKHVPLHELERPV